MKKSAAALIIIIIALAFTLGFSALPSDTAYADDTSVVEYIMGPTGDLTTNSAVGASAIPIRNFTTGEILFYLPESYYVKVISENSILNSFIVEYAGIPNLLILFSEAGDIQPAAVNFDAGVSPYPNLLLQLAEGASITIGNVSISSSDGYTIRFVGFNGDDVYVTASKNADVLSGLVLKSAFTPFSVPYHPITEAERQAIINPPVNGDGKVVPTSSNTLRIILIIGIIVPAVLIVFLLFKPSKDGGNNYDKRAVKRRRADDYDYDRDRRYESGKNTGRYDRYDRGYRDYRYDREDHPDRRGGRDRDYPDRDYRDRDDRDYPSNPRDYDDRRRYDR